MKYRGSFRLLNSAAPPPTRPRPLAIIVPAHVTPEVQELHLPVYHYLCRAVEAHFFPE